jgi:hypothetical protein
MTTLQATQPRPISSIAFAIRLHWPNVYYGAVPYLNAMDSLTTIQDTYGAESARSIVNYFLSNAKTWKGEEARRIKAELNAMLK